MLHHHRRRAGVQMSAGGVICYDDFSEGPFNVFLDGRLTPTGHIWTEYTQTTKIIKKQSGLAKADYDDNYPHLCTVDTGLKNKRIKMDVVIPSDRSTIECAVRHGSSVDCVSLNVQSYNFKPYFRLTQLLNGSWSLLFEGPTPSFNLGDVLTIEAIDDNGYISATLYNGDTVISSIPPTFMSLFSDSTEQGVFIWAPGSYNTEAYCKSFEVTTI